MFLIIQGKVIPGLMHSSMISLKARDVIRDSAPFFPGYIFSVVPGLSSPSICLHDYIKCQKERRFPFIRSWSAIFSFCPLWRVDWLPCAPPAQDTRESMFLTEASFWQRLPWLIQTCHNSFLGAGCVVPNETFSQRERKGQECCVAPNCICHGLRFVYPLIQSLQF